MDSRTKRDIMFLCLAVVALTGSILLVRSRPVTPVQPPPTQQAQQTPAAPAPKSDPAADLGKSRKPLTGGRNPFALPPGVPAQKAAKKPAVPTATAAVAPVTTPVVVAPAPVAPVPVVPAPAAATTSLPPLTPQPAMAAAVVAAGPRLTGVLNANSRTPTAIIRDGKQRYFAKQGDKVGGRYTVQSISTQKVVLVSAQGKLILKMGGS